MRKIISFFGLLTIFVAPEAMAASPSSATLTLGSKAGGNAQVANIDNRNLILDSNSAATLVIDAPAPLDPAQVEVSVDAKQLPRPTSVGTTLTYQINAADVSGATGNIAVSYATKGVTTLIVSKPGTPPTLSKGDRSELSVESLLKEDCTSIYPTTIAEKTGDEIHLFVLPNGNVVGGFPAVIDENDTVVVHVMAHQAIIPFLRIRRSSAIRTVGNVNILGANLTIPGFSSSAAGASTCSTAEVELRDFAPGKGEIEISVVVAGKTAVTGTIEFAVHALYTGMFSLGAMWTSVQDPQYGLVTGSGGRVITSTQKGSHRLLYTLLYTPFVWGKRDIEVSSPVWHHVNPTVGLVLNSPFEHGIAGLSVDFFDGFVLTGGLHVSHVSVVNTDSGFGPGSVLPQEISEVPSAKQWKTGYFWGVSVDLRAAVQFIQTALTARSK